MWVLKDLAGQDSVKQYSRWGHSISKDWTRYVQTSPTCEEFSCELLKIQLDGADGVWRGRDLKVRRKKMSLSPMKHDFWTWASEQKGLYCFRDVEPLFLLGKKWRVKALQSVKRTTDNLEKESQPPSPIVCLSNLLPFLCSSFPSHCHVKTSKVTSFKGILCGLYRPPSCRVWVSVNNDVHSILETFCVRSYK